MVVQQRVAEEEIASLMAERERKARDLAALSANLATYDEESAASEARVAAQMTELAAAAAQMEELRAEVAYWVSQAAHGDNVAARLQKELKELRAESDRRRAAREEAPRERRDAAGPCRKRILLFSTCSMFSYVCPEPVLLNDRF